ncbi:MAG: PDZ domain-containing protein [Planctomycetota bacterium]|jgi:S1-C subfamily serine protease
MRPTWIHRAAAACWIGLFFTLAPPAYTPDAEAGEAAGSVIWIPRLGVSCEPGNQPPPWEGVRIKDVKKGSPAEEGGLRSGDVIAEVAGERIRDIPHLRTRIKGWKEDSRVRISAIRGGRRLELEIGKREKMPPKAVPPGRPARLGVYCDADKQPPAGEGVRVTGVTIESPAREGGIRTGDVIVSADGKKIGDLEGLRAFLKTKRIGERTRFEVVRAGKRESVMVTFFDPASRIPKVTVKAGDPEKLKSLEPAPPILWTVDDLPSTSLASAAVGDLDGDGVADIVFGTY